MWFVALNHQVPELVYTVQEEKHRHWVKPLSRGMVDVKTIATGLKPSPEEWWMLKYGKKEQCMDIIGCVKSGTALFPSGATNTRILELVANND